MDCIWGGTGVTNLKPTMSIQKQKYIFGSYVAKLENEHTKTFMCFMLPL